MTTLRISLGELVAAIPLVLGSQPHEQIVALSVNQEGLPTCALTVSRVTLLDPFSAGVTAAAVAEEFAHEGTELAVLVSYTECDVRGGCAALETLRLEVEFAVPRVELLAVQHDRWFRPGCSDDDCCPPGGRFMADVPQELPAILEAARRRAEAASSVSSKAPAAAARQRHEREQAARAWQAALTHGGVADAATARSLAATLDDLCVRDFVVLRILGADEEAASDALEGIESGAVGEALDAALAGATAPDGPAAERSRAVVDRVVKAARGKRRKAATHTLAAVLEWWEGNLTGAVERCDLALASDPDYRLATLVHLAAERGIGPGWVRTVRHTSQ